MVHGLTLKRRTADSDDAWSTARNLFDASGSKPLSETFKPNATRRKSCRSGYLTITEGPVLSMDDSIGYGPARWPRWPYPGQPPRPGHRMMVLRRGLRAASSCWSRRRGPRRRRIRVSPSPPAVSSSSGPSGAAASSTWWAAAPALFGYENRPPRGLGLSPEARRRPPALLPAGGLSARDRGHQTSSPPSPCGPRPRSSPTRTPPSRCARSSSPPSTSRAS